MKRRGLCFAALVSTLCLEAGYSPLDAARPILAPGAGTSVSAPLLVSLDGKVQEVEYRVTVLFFDDQVVSGNDHVGAAAQATHRDTAVPDADVVISRWVPTGEAKPALRMEPVAVGRTDQRGVLVARLEESRAHHLRVTYKGTVVVNHQFGTKVGSPQEFEARIVDPAGSKPVAPLESSGNEADSKVESK